MPDISLTIDPISLALFAILFGAVWSLSSRIDTLFVTLTGKTYSAHKRNGGEK